MDFSDAQRGLNHPHRAISREASQNPPIHDTITRLQNTPPEIWEKLEPWERKIIGIVKKVQKSNKIGVDLSGEPKSQY